MEVLLRGEKARKHKNPSSAAKTVNTWLGQLPLSLTPLLAKRTPVIRKNEEIFFRLKWTGTCLPPCIRTIR
jgi:hypothetical protein